MTEPSRGPGTARALADDAEIFTALAREREREERFLELIASENYVSEAVMAAQGSPLTNKYADGYPGRRTYSGCEFVDTAERLAIDRAKRLFGAGHANVQPYSGTSANAAAYAALMRPGDTLLGMRAGHGGHITHGHASSFAGQLFDVASYGVGGNGWIDYERAAALARKHRPQVVVAGFSAYSRIVDWQAFREIADSVGAYFVADMAHVAGLVAAGLYPNPVSIADVTTTTTHKTLRGPRGGMLLARDDADLNARLDAAVYPGQQGGPLMHVVAAKAVAFGEALEPAFVEYQRRVLDNARALAETLTERGLTLVTGGTDNHMVLVELAPLELAGPTAERALERAHIASNSIPLPDGGAGLRLGTPAVTTRGLGRAETIAVAECVADILAARGADAAVETARERVLALCAAHPVYAGRR